MKIFSLRSIDVPSGHIYPQNILPKRNVRIIMEIAIKALSTISHVEIEVPIAISGSSRRNISNGIGSLEGKTAMAMRNIKTDKHKY
jgi:hypothetical protein